MTRMAAERAFALLGEPLALDLVNTRVYVRGRLVDLLTNVADLAAWLQAERQRVSWQGPAAAADLAALRALRVAVDEVVAARRLGRVPRQAAIDAVNRALAQPAAPPVLAWGARGPEVLVAYPPAQQRRALLRAIAVSTLQLVTGSDAARLRECANPDCRLQFVAHRASRKWCSAARCGNRARVARHYAKHREPAC